MSKSRAITWLVIIMLCLVAFCGYLGWVWQQIPGDSPSGKATAAASIQTVDARPSTEPVSELPIDAVPTPSPPVPTDVPEPAPQLIVVTATSVEQDICACAGSPRTIVWLTSSLAVLNEMQAVTEEYSNGEWPTARQVETRILSVIDRVPEPPWCVSDIDAELRRGAVSLIDMAYAADLLDLEQVTDSGSIAIGALNSAAAKLDEITVACNPVW